MLKIAMMIYTLALLTACSEQTVYLKRQCPYIEPIEVTITTNDKGGLDHNETAKIFSVVKYYKKEAIRLKREVAQ